MKRLGAFGAAVLMLLAVPFVTGAAPTINVPLSSGPIGIETQSWWLGAGVNSIFPGAHVHLSATNWPYRATVKGTLPVDFTLLLHNNPGTVKSIRAHAAWDGGAQYTFETRTLNWHPGAVDAATMPLHFNLDTSKVSVDGWVEVRFLVIVDQPTGDRQELSTGYQLNLNNGKASHVEYRAGAGVYTEGKGWYTQTEYESASFRSALPTAPLGPGVWSPSIALVKGAGGSTVTYHAVYLDPDFHHGSSGTTLLSGSGEYRGTVAVDTTKLTPGQHKLVLRTDSTVAAGTTSGLIAFTFTVGGASSSPPSPTATPVTTPSATPAATPTPTHTSSTSTTPSSAPTPSSSPTPTLNPCATLPPG